MACFSIIVFLDTPVPCKKSKFGDHADSPIFFIVPCLMEFDYLETFSLGTWQWLPPTTNFGVIMLFTPSLIHAFSNSLLTSKTAAI